jgi:hypothetical protein
MSRAMPPGCIPALQRRHLERRFTSAAATDSIVVNPEENSARARFAETCFILVRSVISAWDPPRIRSLKTAKTLSRAQSPMLRAKIVT